jgi:hypothetical protein
VEHSFSRTTCAVVSGLGPARFVINEQGFGWHRRTQDRGIGIQYRLLLREYERRVARERRCRGMRYHDYGP